MSVVLLERREKGAGQPQPLQSRETAVLHFEALGRGRPVIFLHTWVGSWRYWIPSMQDLVSSWRTYALDLWGYGDSAHDPALYNLDDNVALLDGFLEAMGIDSVSLVGHGLGAVVAAEFSRRCPQSVERLVLVGFPLGREQASDRLWSIPLADLAGWLAGRVEDRTGLQEFPKTDPVAVEANLRSIQGTGWKGMVRGLCMPCLLVYGGEDPSVRPLSSEDEQRWPDSVGWVSLSGCGHFPMLDDSARFNRLLADFLRMGVTESPRTLQVKEGWRRRVR